jgi:hypothetical protein
VLSDDRKKVLSSIFSLFFGSKYRTLIFREDTFIYFFVVPAGLIILFNSYVLLQAFREAR